MDRNQAIGMVLISVMIFTYFIFFSSPPKPDEKLQGKQTQQQIKVDDSKIQPKNEDPKNYGSFSTLLEGKGEEVVLQNADIKVLFNSKGGQMKQVELKKYKTYTQKFYTKSAEPMVLFASKNSQMELKIPVGTKTIDLYQLNYKTTQNANQLSFVAEAEGQKVEQIYTLEKNGYIVDYQLKVNGFDAQKQAQFVWKAQLENTEKDIAQSRLKSTIKYSTVSEGYDYMSESIAASSEEVAKPLRWVAFKQQFFLASIIAKGDNQFNKATLKTEANEKDSTFVKYYEANLEIPIANLQTGKGKFQFYVGPTEFYELSKVEPDFVRTIGLGWGFFSVLNKYAFIPLLKFLESLTSYYGLVILLLVLAIRVVLFPLSYKSFVSMAKTKVLKPQIDEIKARTNEDKQAFQSQQMELFRQVGVNPLSGCIPMLLQMPILISVFQFFPNAIELRQQGFLWAEDLSTYDSILQLPFTIPFGYGSHVSLFTIFMTISTLVYTWYNNQTTTVEGPYKTMGYVMPVVFMFVLNSYSSGLSFYYFCANVASVLQQIGIKRLVNEDKIKSLLESNKLKNKDKKKSGFQQRLEEAMKASKDSKEVKNLPKKNNKA
jgi:YidC/Oxa1 family membrane protein insertase